MPLMPNAYVTSAKFTGGKIKLTVVVDDFSQYGGYVEISGQAAQTNGAFADFYSVEEVPPNTNLDPDPNIPGDTAHYVVYVSAAPVSEKKKFRKNLDVTTIMRVARVWLTVLGKNQASGVAVEGTTWKEKEVSSVGGDW
jgi:hypothetical protein